ncbi:MAG: hypothetical protein JXQ71_01225 [Verrucomicrobia bacterium]|nr:hypothetical protein [Verrucomicrobiota bacterium]
MANGECPLFKTMPPHFSHEGGEMAEDIPCGIAAAVALVAADPACAPVPAGALSVEEVVSVSGSTLFIKVCGLGYRELSAQAQIQYVSVSTAVRRFAARVAKDGGLARLLERATREMHNE